MTPSPNDQRIPGGEQEQPGGQRDDRGGGDELLQRAAADFLLSGLGLLLG